MFATVLLYTFLVVVAIQIIYYLFFSAFAFAKNKQKSVSNLVPISVVVCAKNEAKNLQKNLPHILEQKYSNFEVVLINDASSDETLEVMKSFQKKHTNIKLVNVENNENFWGNKKYALTLGIKAATNEHLLFTDADCKPASKHWITEMVSHFSDKKTNRVQNRK